MNKSLVAFITAMLAAATMFASSAEAGFRIRLGFGGPLPSFTAHGNGGGSYERRIYRKRYYARHTVKKEKSYIAKRKTPEPKVAKKETEKPTVVAKAPVAEPDVIADSENSSITTASIAPQDIAPIAAKTESADAPPPEQKPAKAASKLDCKKFFPSVGMTLTVRCE